MPDTFWMVKDPEGTYLLSTLSSGRNHATAKLFNLEAYGRRGKRKWGRMYDAGYRLVKMEIKET